MSRLILRPNWLITASVTLLTSAIVTSAEPDRGQGATDDVERVVAGLGSDSYLTRMRSQHKLLELAMGDEATERRVRSLLHEESFPPQDLELALLKRSLLSRLEQRHQEIRMERFLYDPSFDDRVVVGWDQFRLDAGDQLESRLVFAAAVRDRPGFGHLVVGLSKETTHLPELEAADSHDIASWALLLLAASRRKATVADGNLLRLTALLRNPGSGPEAIRDHERRVLSRMVESFLSQAPIDARDRMVIGLRYGCDLLTESECRSVLNQSDESPSRIVTALLVASALDFSPAEIDQWIARFRDDSRVSHVWRSMTPPKTTHRTQVRDVALALQLHRAGIDPRTRGFSVVVADPILVFRPYSLGFESEELRRQAERNR